MWTDPSRRQSEASDCFATPGVEIASCGGPTVPLHPAPWTLQGNGLILLTRTPSAALKADPSIPEAVRSSLKAPLNILMLVNYTRSDAGPYQELLFVPGTASIAGRRLATISNILVSTDASVVNGRINWGIPKYRADFDWSAAGSGQHVQVSQGGRGLFDLTYAGRGVQFPVNTAWIPSGLKTLGQTWEDRHFIFSPQAKGRARRAKITSLNVAPGQFPAISAQHIVAAFEITSFDMEFPVPQTL